MSPPIRWPVRVEAYLDIRTRDAILRLADRNERSVAAEVRAAIKAHLKATAGAAGNAR